MEELTVVPKTINHAKYIKIWKVSKYLKVGVGQELIELYFCFTQFFPNVLPDVYFLDRSFDPIPHLDYNNRKLCIVRDSVYHNVDNMVFVMEEYIEDAFRLVKLGLNGNLDGDYISEIMDYWILNYSTNDYNYGQHYVISERLPEVSMVLHGLCYANSYGKEVSLYFEDESHNVVVSIKKLYQVKICDAIFLSSFELPKKPPYRMTPQRVLELIDENDNALLRDFLKRKSWPRLLFKMAENKIGGLLVDNIKYPSGFRKDRCSRWEIFSNYCRDNTLRRFGGDLYSKLYMSQRTSGDGVLINRYIVAGVGSVGSNLCFYLSGNDHVRFSLVDTDVLSLGNIGRHFLGLEQVGQSKSRALCDWLNRKRPDSLSESYTSSIQEYIEQRLSDVNFHDAMFLCTGNIMSEQYIIGLINSGKITIPVFL